MSPTRRPLKRIRLNAYAASADSNTVAAALDRAKNSEFPYHVVNGVLRNRSRALSKLAPVGHSWELLSVPTGLSAAEITNNTGKTAKAATNHMTTCRHPRRVHQRVKRVRAVGRWTRRTTVSGAVIGPPPAGPWYGSD